MSAESIATALRGRKVGHAWMARCPVHDDREPSLSIRDGDNGVVLVRCHAGCDQRRVIAALRSRGLWDVEGDRPLTRFESRPIAVDRRDHDAANRTEAALSIWKTAMPAAGTPVETYFASRSLHLPPPPTLRFIAGLRHPCGGVWPAMIALVTRGTDHTPLAIHRTFLSHNGAGKAPVKPPKMMLGPCKGGAVRLRASSTVLMIGEGIETCLAAMQATSKPAWAALSTSGLRALDLPNDVRDVIVLADGDDPGEAAARESAHRWKRDGRRVRIARPPRGLDFNDLLLGRRLRVDEVTA